MTTAIRPMQPADLAQVLDLAAVCPEAPQWQPADYSPYLNPSPEPPLLRSALVAVSPKEKIHAFATAALLLDGEQNLCQLDSVAVHPDVRRQGIGAALLHALLAWAAQNGARHLSLEVRPSNTAALRLYERLGLRPEGLRPRYYTHPEEDALLLGRDITVGPLRARFPR
jgi:[ribosomal protein S18]-alanine N-acetyltransferase